MGIHQIPMIFVTLTKGRNDLNRKLLSDLHYKDYNDPEKFEMCNI